VDNDTGGLGDVLRFVARERERIWWTIPSDILRLRGRKGARQQNFTVTMYADGDTRAVGRYLYHLRESSLSDDIDLHTLMQVTLIFLRFDQRRLLRYFELHDAAAVFSRVLHVLPTVHTTSEYRQLIEELLLYVNRLNYWIDLQIPWHKLVTTFSKST
jgi:hypothetical protein